MLQPGLTGLLKQGETSPSVSQLNWGNKGCAGGLLLPWLRRTGLRRVTEVKADDPIERGFVLVPGTNSDATLHRWSLCYSVLGQSTTTM